MNVSDAPLRIAHRIQLLGKVQGLGVRPAIARLATDLGLAGGVRNTSQGLEIDIEGPAEVVADFEGKLPSVLPSACVLQSCLTTPARYAERIGFDIDHGVSGGRLGTPVPTDIATCPACLAEARDPAQRRSGYPLISCTACGPRYSLIRRMPYERRDTALAEFQLCGACDAEYASPSDRRFHAQTTGCTDCGPNVWATGAGGRALGTRESAHLTAVGALRQGHVVAVKGVGGYQLLCDAGNELAVHRLRQRKSRPSKPFAVLVGSIALADQIAHVDETERRLLRDSSNPIVLLKSSGSAGIAPSVHPDLDSIGILLPTTALHDRLAREFGRPLVCTSGNVEGEPLEFDVESAERTLAPIADLWLHHDRTIERPIDDSVVRVIAGRPVTLRLARGLAPLPLDLPPGPPLVALGGHQKSAIAWCNGAQCALGPHIGDLETLSSRQRFLEHVSSIEALYGFTPEALVHDRHPDYFTTRLATECGMPTLAVPHHFAHIAAGMLENGLLDRTVLGIAFDGTGFGTDGTIWGGEILLARGVGRMDRIASLRPFSLPGGEAAIREPWRTAVSLLSQVLSREVLTELRFDGVAPAPLGSLLQLLERPGLSLVTTSAGRLFDAAAALILSITVSQFDGQPAMWLEATADPCESGAYPLPVAPGRIAQLDWRPLFAALWDDRLRQTNPGTMAMRFHRGLASGIARFIRSHPELPVVLSGGVFQNRLLTELLLEELDGDPRVHLPGRIPPNDGGLAAGQLAYALGQRDWIRGLSGPQ